MMVDTKKEVSAIYFYGRIKEKGGRKNGETKRRKEHKS
jgi:hypothetical protein